jgi:hypothetical protein
MVVALVGLQLFMRRAAAEVLVRLEPTFLTLILEMAVLALHLQ